MEEKDLQHEPSILSLFKVWLGYLELFGFLAIINMQAGEPGLPVRDFCVAQTSVQEGKTDRKPGDFGLRGFYPADAKGQYEMQVKALKQGMFLSGLDLLDG